MEQMWRTCGTCVHLARGMDGSGCGRLVMPKEAADAEPAALQAAAVSTTDLTSRTFPATMLARRGRKPAASIPSASFVMFLRIVMLGIEERRRRVPLRTVSQLEGFCCRLESESSRLSLRSILDRLSSSVVAERVPGSKPSRSIEWPRLSVSSAVDNVFAAESAWGPSFDLTGVPTDVLSARANVFGEGGNASSPPATLYRLIMVEGICTQMHDRGVSLPA